MINKKANFGSEESCRLHFKEEREKIGVQCKCGNKEYFWIKNRWSSECKKWRSRTSFTKWHYNAKIKSNVVIMADPSESEQAKQSTVSEGIETDKNQINAGILKQRSYTI